MTTLFNILRAERGRKMMLITVQKYKYFSGNCIIWQANYKIKKYTNTYTIIGD